MFAIHARYRGGSSRRADLVQRSARALETLEGVGEFETLGVEDIRAVIDDAPTLADVVMALLADGEWAIGIGITAGDELAEDSMREVATSALKKNSRAGQVHARAAKEHQEAEANDIAAAFGLLGYVLSKRTLEGREATALVRSGYNQNEAAAELGISKQAMSQRLHAAGWGAESAGWQLAVNLLKRAGLD